MNTDFWRDRRVLLTGHTGFKGSWLSLWLQQMQADLCGYALAPPTDPSLFEVARVGRGMTSIEADVRDEPRLRKALESFRPEVVFHMAAQPLVRLSYEDPVETYSTNVLGTVHLLQAARSIDSVRAVVVITSDKCYLNQEWAWGYRENEPMGGDDPYSSSKGCAELVTASFRKSFFSDPASAGVASVRAGNVIGGGDWARDRLVPDIMTAIRQGEPVQIRYPHAVRPWQHVLEPLRGYLLLAERLHASHEWADGWNFGPRDGDSRPVGWIADTLTKAWGRGARWETDDARHPHENTYLKLDSTRAHQLLEWNPCLSLEDALRWIVEWYQALDRDADMRAQTLADVERYEQRCRESGA